MMNFGQEVVEIAHGEMHSGAAGGGSAGNAAAGTSGAGACVICVCGGGVNDEQQIPYYPIIGSRISPAG